MSIPATGVAAWLRLTVAVKELRLIYTARVQAKSNRGFAKISLFFKFSDKTRAADFTDEHRSDPCSFAKIRGPFVALITTRRLRRIRRDARWCKDEGCLVPGVSVDQLCAGACVPASPKWP